MRVSGLLRTLRDLSIHLEADGARLRYRALQGALNSRLREEILANKRPLLDALKQRQTAYEEWKAALKEISALWNRTRASRGEAPFLPEKTDSRLTRAVGGAIRGCDLPRTRGAIRAWRSAWVATLRPAWRLEAEELCRRIFDPNTPAAQRRIYREEFYERGA